MLKKQITISLQYTIENYNMLLYNINVKDFTVLMFQRLYKCNLFIHAVFTAFICVQIIGVFVYICYVNSLRFVNNVNGINLDIVL